MKILLISVKSKVSRGGIATWTDRFLSKCNDHGIFCDLVNTELVGKRAERQISKRNIADEFVRTRRIFKDLRKYLNTAKYDAAHLNTSCGTFGLFRDYAVAKRIKKKNIKLVVHFHCDIPYWIHNSISKKYLGKLIAISDERLVLCENSRSYLEKTYNASSQKVPNFIDDSHIAEASKKISEKLTNAVFVGRVSESKGATEIYELAKRLPDISFCLVGDISDEVAGWEKTENVELVGGIPHAEVLKQLDRADVFLLPSHSEGFSLALTEAMARALPAVATNVGANADMLDGGCGIITAVGDVCAMEKALEELRSPQIRKEMSDNAVRKVKEQYVADNIVESFKKYY